MPTDHPNYPVAGVGRRLGAIIYDACLLFAVLFTATLPFILLSDKVSQPVANKQIVYEFNTPDEGIFYQLYLIVIIFIFFTWFWRRGKTLGMQAWRLEIESLDGNRLSVKQCIIRVITAAFSLICFGAGIWWIWVDKDKLAWHDRLSNSKIVQTQKEK